MAARIIAPGKTFNSWTAIRFAERRGTNYYWFFRCVCGKERVVQVSGILAGNSKSCGTGECAARGRKLSIREKRLAVMFNDSRKGARNREMSFTISKSDISTLAEKQQWRCARTGISLDLTLGGPFGASIDRIDNNRGYEPDNIQLVCKLYNLCKNQFTDEDVFLFAKALITHSDKSTTQPDLRIVA